MTKNTFRPIEICGDIARVHLTRGYFATIDVADAELVAGIHWSAMIKRGIVYAKSNTAWALLHRHIMKPDPGFQVDHINGDGLDNRRDNLRIATHAQNIWNQKRNARNTSGLRGVSWCAPANKWRARITADGAERHLGVFSDPADAKEAFDQEVRKLRGEFGRAE